MKIVLIGDLKGHGKTTFAKELKKQLKLKSEILSFAGPLKEHYKERTGVDFDRLSDKDDGRKAIHELAGILKKDYGQNVFVNIAMSSAVSMYPNYAIIDDLRCDFELLEVAKAFSSDLISIRVRRKEKAVEIGTHETEKGVKESLYDSLIEVMENGVEYAVAEFIEEFGL